MSVTDDTAPAAPTGPPVRRRRTARNAAIVVGVVMVALIALLATRGTQDSVSSRIVGQAAPPVTGAGLDGTTFDTRDHRGEWVLVNFFATWCGPCRVEHPELVKFAQKYEGQPVQVVSVAFDDQSDKIRQFFAKEGGDWPVLASDTSRVALDYGITGVPETYVVAPSGLVVARIDTGFTVAKAESVIDAYGGVEATTGVQAASGTGS